MLIKINETTWIETNNIESISLVTKVFPDSPQEYTPDTNTIIREYGYSWSFGLISGDTMFGTVFKSEQDANQWLNDHRLP